MPGDRGSNPHPAPAAGAGRPPAPGPRLPAAGVRAAGKKPSTPRHAQRTASPPTPSWTPPYPANAPPEFAVLPLGLRVDFTPIGYRKFARTSGLLEADIWTAPPAAAADLLSGI